jgi:hypothetical protein
MNPQVENCWIAFSAWYFEHHVEPIETEKRLWAHDWCGQLDLYCWFNGVPYVIDHKTSRALYHKDRIQVAGYRGEMEKQGHNVDGHGVLRLDKESGAFEWRDYSKFYEKDLKEFQLIHDLYMIRHPIIAKQFKEGK